MRQRNSCLNLYRELTERRNRTQSGAHLWEHAIDHNLSEKCKLVGKQCFQNPPLRSLRMLQMLGTLSCISGRVCRKAVPAVVLLASTCAYAQLFMFPKQELIDYTSKSPFDRLADGRPKVPDALIERARDLSSEEVWAGLEEERGFKNQYADGFQVLQPGKTMVGRAFTVQFMPLRGDVDEVAKKKAREHGLAELSNQTAIDMLQPGDVLVVDLFGKKVDGTIVGDNLFYYVMKATNGGGLVVDGSIRDLDGIVKIDMPAYFRSVDPTPIGNVMLTGINVPIRIGGVTVMPGDSWWGIAKAYISFRRNSSKISLTTQMRSISTMNGPKRDWMKENTNLRRSTARRAILKCRRSIGST